ncbi:hypothetical protein HBH98_171140 [Parastagonospora nodorum]|nr:hypothetical protein HBH51_181790 [Parastagonospora nodorum]KAH4024718.1 hypothetical protein HBI09_157520 [Parastagonospora nodorum]KAH4046018.1 hypothetical protein HBH49_192330 [Parastagonospora nodorum]KAH4060191.1 hypothetical protein HBH50_223360 [Parastagonospora nodorum]KAH4082736.1 hypothetical protein HBH48_182610 [Parastagonospora nodorum]
MGIVPPWRYADEDPSGAVVIGWYVHVLSIAILVFIWPIFIILTPIMVPLCIIGISIHFFAWLYRTIRDQGIRGPTREIYDFLRWLRRDLRDAWLDFCDAFRELMHSWR